MPPANTSEPNRLPSDGNTSRSTKLPPVMTCDTERVGKESLTAHIPENQGATDSEINDTSSVITCSPRTPTLNPLKTFRCCIYTQLNFLSFLYSLSRTG